VKAEQSYNNKQYYSSVDTGDEELSIEYTDIEIPQIEKEPEKIAEVISEETEPELKMASPAIEEEAEVVEPAAGKKVEETKKDESEFTIDNSELKDIFKSPDPLEEAY